jgi:hypothetical protein
MGASAAVAEGIARSAVQSTLGALLDMACDRLAYVLRRLFELALVRLRMTVVDVDAFGVSSAGPPPPVAFQTALRRAHDRFVLQQTRKCKELVRHHLATSTRSEVALLLGTFTKTFTKAFTKYSESARSWFATTSPPPPGQSAQCCWENSLKRSLKHSLNIQRVQGAGSPPPRHLHQVRARNVVGNIH